jgi:AraC-like DNA-binding protein
MKQISAPPNIKIWRLPDVDNVEFIRAAAMTQPTPRQFHQEFVVGVMEQGCHKLSYRGATTMAYPGHLLLAQPGELLSCDPGLEGSYTFRALHSTPGLLQQTAGEIGRRPATLPFFAEPIMTNPSLSIRFLSFHRRMETPVSLLERSCLLQEMLAQIITCCTAEPPTWPSLGRERDPVRQVRNYLQDNYAENVSLEQLARVANLSAFHLNRVFRQEVGLPPHAYQTQVRVARAKALLAQGWSIRQAASEVGFFDQSHLTYHFKRLLGFTPGTYQQNILAE